MGGGGGGEEAEHHYVFSYNIANLLGAPLNPWLNANTKIESMNCACVCRLILF